MKKIIYIANARIPTQKAHGGAIMNMCESFAHLGFDVELVIPQRSNRNKEDPFGYYDVEENFRIRKLPCLEWKMFDKIWFFIQWLSFAKFAAFYGLSNKVEWYYGRDELSLWFISWFRKNIVWEAHTAKDNVVVRSLLKRCRGVVTISSGLKEYFVSLGMSPQKVFTAHSGVDLNRFEVQGSKSEMRQKLGLPLNKKLVAYVGKLATMGKGKGVEDLELVINEVKKTYPEVELIVVSDVKPKEVAEHMKAVDVLVMNYPNTLHYAKYMSPLKMFEYMASKRPIITTDLPSIREVLDDDSALLVSPGDKAALSAGIERLLKNEELGEHLASQAYDKVKAYTWGKRAQKVITFLELIS